MVCTRLAQGLEIRKNIFSFTISILVQRTYNPYIQVFIPRMGKFIIFTQL